MGNNYIYTILQDSRGNVWFGTDGNGLVKYSNGSFQFFDENSGIGDDVVYAITEDENGEIWFSTSSSGLYSYDGSIFKNYSTSEGLSSQNILSIACKDQHVFILTDKGLDVFHKEGNIFINMFEDSENEKLQADLNSVYTGKNYVCFAVQSGLIIVKTNAFDNNTYEPVTLLDWVTVNLQALSDTNEQKFSSDENRFVFEYSGLWFPSPQKVRYKVKLDGFDPEWKTTYDHSVSYPNLPPGKYTFKVVSFLGMDVAQGKQASFSFEIKKPFYRQVWFIILVAAILVFLIYRFIIFRETRLKQIEARKKEKLEFEFQTLKNQVNPHFLFNSFSTLISIIEENPEKAVNYTEALSDFFRDILEVKDQELIPLKEEIRMIKNFNFIQQQRFGDQFLLKIELDELSLNSVIPPLTLQLLTENAIKHNVVSKSKPLVVLIKNDVENIYVENNRNTKKTVEKSTGIGLQNIRDRYKLTSGKEIRVVENDEKLCSNSSNNQQMKILIIEDEPATAKRLEKMLAELLPEARNMGIIDTVEESIVFFQKNTEPDLVFMDIHLADGNSFEIFEKVEINCPVIFTTAYDQYAIKAFKVNSIDYLLKPIKQPELVKSLKKFQKNITPAVFPDYQKIAELLQPKPEAGLKRIVTKIGQTIKALEVSEIAYFVVENKTVYAIPKTGSRLPVEFTMDFLEKELNS